VYHQSLVFTFGRMALTVLVLSALTSRLGAQPLDSNPITQIEIQPASFHITGTRQTLQLIVTGRLSDSELADVTHAVTYRVPDPDPGVVTVTSSGRVSPLRNGTTTVEVQIGTLTRRMKIEVSGQASPELVSFAHHTLPLLAKAGCSGGACHGSPHGKAGFRLSLFGLDPDFDRASIVREFRGRRVNLVHPDDSLLLRKPTMQIPHAGGRRLRTGDPLYSLLQAWIGQGCRQDSENVQCTGIEVFPPEARVLRFPANSQQFNVLAHFSDGSVRDVTPLAQFSLSDVNVAEVTPQGHVTGLKRGETAVIVRYLEFIATPLLTFVRDIEGFQWQAPPAPTYVDELVDEKLKQLQYLPSGLCSDEAFVRRVSLDVIGLLPTPDEARSFASDQSPGKRSRRIDELLERPEFARFQAQKWGDLLRLSRKQIGVTSVFKYSRWLSGAMSSNMPYDRFARELLTASGSTMTSPAGNYYRTAADTLDAMETTAQLFLGTRIQCAKCHNHPFERWTQNDYYGLAAFFNRIERRKTDRPEEVLLWASGTGEIRHPATGRVIQPWVPGDSELAVDAIADRRQAFAAWLTSRDNPFFARVEVNRLWAQVMGRGIVEPFDDFRDSNPPSIAPLLDALAADFVEHGYDRKHVLRTILNSRSYQASSRANKFNRDDDRYFSHYIPRRLTAEQLVDALGDVTGRPEQFALIAPGTRATWLPAPDLKPHDRARLGDIEFLKVFGQPERQSVCACDRSEDSSLGQALELLNGGFLHRMLEHSDNRFHSALKQGRPPQDIVINLYQRALCRSPTDQELRASLGYIASHSSASTALEDVCWAILNKDEFLFQH
jgi:hypothetical protein